MPSLMRRSPAATGELLIAVAMIAFTRLFCCSTSKPKARDSADAAEQTYDSTVVRAKWLPVYSDLIQ